MIFFLHISLLLIFEKADRKIFGPPPLTALKVMKLIKIRAVIERGVRNFVSSQSTVKMFLPKILMRRNYHSYKNF